MERISGQKQNEVPITAIFGAGGFIGSHLLTALKAYHPDAVGTFRTSTAGQSGFTLANPDITPLDLPSKGVTQAIIAAAVTGISACEGNPAATSQVNVEGTLSTARQLTDAGIRVVALSSDYVFDGKTGDYDESSLTAPLNEYGRQKREMEERLMRECGSNVLILRLGKIFDLKPGGGTLLDEMAGKLVRGEKIKAAGDQIFCPTHVDDLVNIMLTLLSTDLSGILHLCAPSRISRYDLALRLSRTFGCDETLVQEISLRDLGETFVRPLDTSMRCPRLAQCMDYRFRLLDDCIDNLKSGYSEIYS